MIRPILFRCESCVKILHCVGERVIAEIHVVFEGVPGVFCDFMAYFC